MIGTIIKIAFVLSADKQSFIYGRKYIPTYRVSKQITPEIKPLHFSAAISEVNKTGSIKPIIIYKPGR
jgi:hypothetical protein